MKFTYFLFTTILFFCKVLFFQHNALIRSLSSWIGQNTTEQSITLGQTSRAKNKGLTFFKDLNVSDKRFDEPITVFGNCILKDATVDGNIKIIGKLILNNKKIDDQETANRIVVVGEANCKNVHVNFIKVTGTLELKKGIIGEKIFITGLLSCVDVSVLEEIKVVGQCSLKNVVTKKLFIIESKNIQNVDFTRKHAIQSEVRLDNVTIDTVVIEADHKVKIYVSSDSKIKRLEFAEESGEVILQDRAFIEQIINHVA